VACSCDNSVLLDGSSLIVTRHYLYDPAIEIRAGTRVLVTGASSGIGRALCEALARRSATVGLVARSEEDLNALAARLPRTGSGHEVLAADVGDRDEIAAAVERFGEVDVVVANAGVADYAPFKDMDLEPIERMTRVNWLGTVYTVHAALPGMLERLRGHLVVVSSGAALRSFPQAAAYGATKAAQRGFAEALWHELAGTGVDVTIVYPGEIATEIHAHERDSLPTWRRVAEEADVDALARRILAAVEKNERAVYFPPLVRALRGAHGLSPKVSDFALRRLRGITAAPRR
jgi:short-subunit dehydrogenase